MNSGMAIALKWIGLRSLGGYTSTYLTHAPYWHRSTFRFNWILAWIWVNAHHLYAAEAISSILTKSSFVADGNHFCYSCNWKIHYQIYNSCWGCHSEYLPEMREVNKHLEIYQNNFAINCIFEGFFSCCYYWCYISIVADGCTK